LKREDDETRYGWRGKVGRDEMERWREKAVR
jgi:hypothetical protein